MKKTSLCLPILVLTLLLFGAATVSGSSVLDYTLKIYGNANLDEDIDDADISYIEEIIAGSKEKTEYADANNDGKIDEADIEQVQNLIDGSATKIIITDSNDRIVSLPYPIQKIAALFPTMAEPIQAMGAADKVVAIDDETAKQKLLLPKIAALPSVGKRAEPDIEKLIELDPDFVVTLCTDDEEIKKIENVGIPVVIMSYGTNDVLDTTFASGMQESKQLGYLLNTREGADRYIDFYRQYLSQVEDKVSTLSSSDRPTVLYTYDYSNGKIQSSGGATYITKTIDFAGAKDITAENPGNWIELDPEFPIKENPAFITYEDVLSRDTTPLIGYGQADPERIEKVIEEIKALPGFNTIDAVKDNHVYAIPYALESHCIWLAALYQAKLYHPELFTELDVPAIHQEYLEKYLGLSPDVYKDSRFIYPTPEGL